MTTHSKNADLGKWAESRVTKWLDQFARNHYGFAYHRYPDARAARGVLAAQPADFLVARRYGTEEIELGRQAWHLEVKETAELKRLPKDKISQYGKLKLFDSAGVWPIVLIYRSSFKDWYLMDRFDLFEHDMCPPSFPFDSRETYASPDPHLERIFG